MRLLGPSGLRRAERKPPSTGLATGKINQCEEIFTAFSIIASAMSKSTAVRAWIRQTGWPAWIVSPIFTIRSNPTAKSTAIGRLRPARPELQRGLADHSGIHLGNHAAGGGDAPRG